MSGTLGEFCTPKIRESRNMLQSLYIMMDSTARSKDRYYLVFSGMIKTRYKDVAHHKNDKSNDCSAHSESRDGIEKG